MSRSTRCSRWPTPERDPGRGVHRGRGLRRVAVPPPGAAHATRPRACSGRCRSTSATPSSSTTRRRSSGRARSRTSRRSRWRSCGQCRGSSSTAARGTGIALDTGVDSGGGWFIEQWFARASELYADNGNGRSAPATQVLFDGPIGVDAADVGAVADRRRARRQRRRQPERPGRVAQARRPGAAGGDDDRHVGGDRHRDNVLDGGLIPGHHERPSSASGRCPAPARSRRRSSAARRCTSSATRATPAAAAAWDFIQYLVAPQSQSTWASATGYVPIREDAARRSSR